jgi:phosphoenolpyruvate-protein phosphotransferase (PTS system enzyme I)
VNMMSKSVIPGHNISPGVATGSLCYSEMLFICPVDPEAPLDRKPETEMKRFKEEVATLIKDLVETVDSLESESFSAEAEIIRAHIAMLQDPMFHAQVEHVIRRLCLAAESAVEHVIQDVIRAIMDSKDDRLSERAADLRDLARQLKAKLSRDHADLLPETIGSRKDPVIAIPELYPSVVLSARRQGVKAFLVEKGTALSHGAILAKAFALPVLRLSNLEMVRTSYGANVLVDANAGELLIEPNRREIEGRVQPAIEVPWDRTDYPLPVQLWANIATPLQLEGFGWQGVEGVGLYRTETLFMEGNDDFPGEEKQVEVYAHLFSLCGGRPVTVRTADLGADKPLSYMSFGPQDNPYLGLRGHRIYHFHPELLVTQLRAILRAAAGPHHLRLLYPMLETVEQWQFIQQLVQQAIASLRADRLPFQQQFEQGVLVETPAAVLGFQRFVKVIDFASIGTNDLVQYLFAVDRNNANVADLYQPEHPIVLQVLKSLIDQTHETGKSLSICGEVAGDPEMLPWLVGLGFKHLSVGLREAHLLRVRLRSLKVSACRKTAQACLEAGTAAEVRTILGIRRQETIDDMPPQLPRGQALDPVCKMIVKTEGNPYSLVCQGRRYFFCCRSCTLRFQKETEGGMWQ